MSRSQYFITQIQYSDHWSIHCNCCTSLKHSSKVWHCESAGIYVFGFCWKNLKSKLKTSHSNSLNFIFWQEKLLENYSILWLFENWLGLKGKVFILFILLTSTATKLNETCHYTLMCVFNSIFKIISHISFTRKEGTKLNILSAHL